MSLTVRQQIQAHLSKPELLDSFLSDVRHGTEPCPSDFDILQALTSLSVHGCRIDAVSVSVLDAIRSAAIANATARITRRRLAARRQRQRTLAKLRQSNHARRLVVSPLSPPPE